MSKDWKQILADYNRNAGLMAKALPDALSAFGSLAVTATKPGHFDKKTKELVAVAISICIRCEGCIAYHLNAAIKHGATIEEVAEIVALAIEMGGGPSTVYGGYAMEAYGQLAT